jgi:CBS domain-containing protein
MTLRDLPDVIKSAPPLMADDSAGKAIRLLRARGLPALPVADGSQLLGFVREQDLADLAIQTPDPGAAAVVHVQQLVRPIALAVRDDQDAVAVLRLMQEHDTDAAAVIAGDGRFLGLVLRRDLLAAATGEHPAPQMAGLATPFGVYLTTGALRAGASDLALASTGAALMIIYLLSEAILYGFGRLAAPLPPLAWLFGSEDSLARMAALYVVFLLLLRFSPLASIHASEHMVVRAIEEGEDLTVQKVRAMSRVHPRCGTNLMVLVSLLTVIIYSVSAAGRGSGNWLAAVPVLILIVVLAQRRLGAGLQRWITTRTPSDARLQAAIRVGESLLAQAKTRPAARVAIWRRLWNAGFVQVLAGFAVGAAVIEYGWPLVASHWPHLIR